MTQKKHPIYHLQGEKFFTLGTEDRFDRRSGGSYNGHSLEHIAPDHQSSKERSFERYHRTLMGYDTGNFPLLSTDIILNSDGNIATARHNFGITAPNEVRKRDFHAISTSESFSFIFNTHIINDPKPTIFNVHRLIFTPKEDGLHLTIKRVVKEVANDSNVLSYQETLEASTKVLRGENTTNAVARFVEQTLKEVDHEATRFFAHEIRDQMLDIATNIANSQKSSLATADRHRPVTYVSELRQQGTAIAP